MSAVLCDMGSSAVLRGMGAPVPYSAERAPEDDAAYE